MSATINMPNTLTEPGSRCAASAPRTSRVVGLMLLSALLLMAALGPVVSGHDAISQQLGHVRQAPDATHWLGTDHLGRDQFTRLAMALRVSLVGGLLTVLVAAALGAGLGLLAAWRQGWVERLAVMLADCAMALPGLLLVLLVAAIAPGSFSALYLGLAATLWVEHFRLVRAMSRRVLASPGWKPPGCWASARATSSAPTCCPRCCPCSPPWCVLAWPMPCWPWPRWAWWAWACNPPPPNWA